MRRIAYSVAIREAIEEEMRRDSSVFLLGEDIAEHGGCFGVTRSLVERFGRDRVRNTPISENGMVGIALGAALLGMRPVAEIMFMDFITLAMDQLVNHPRVSDQRDISPPMNDARLPNRNQLLLIGDFVDEPV